MSDHELTCSACPSACDGVGFDEALARLEPISLEEVVGSADLQVRKDVKYVIRPDELAPAPNSVIVRSAPHTRLLPEAAVAVTHGGHGTVMAALMHRRPMLVIPHGRDQGDNAVRITERGAGLMLPAAASAEEIRAALRRLLEDPAFAAAARRLGDAVAAEAEGATLVADLAALAAGRAAQGAAA